MTSDPSSARIPFDSSSNGARAVRPEFRPSDDDLRRVGELCRRLDGMPLAIEVAVARLGEQGLEQILNGLRRSTVPLERGRGTPLRRA